MTSLSSVIVTSPLDMSIAELGHLQTLLLALLKYFLDLIQLGSIDTRLAHVNGICSKAKLNHRLLIFGHVRQLPDLPLGKGLGVWQPFVVDQDRVILLGNQRRWHKEVIGICWNGE